MSRHQLELLPPATRARVARLRATRRTALAAATTAAGAAAIALGAIWLDRHSSTLLADAQASGAPVVAIEEEIARIREEGRAIEEELDFQREIGVAIPASGLIGAIATALPDGATLERLALAYDNVQGTNRKLRRGAKEEILPRMLRGELRGIAADEAGVGRIVDALGALAPLEEVSLDSSRSREFHGRSVREFRIAFRIDLEKRWRLPEVISTPSAVPPAASAEDRP